MDSDPASINIEYVPAWENLHVQKRVKKVLDWAAQFVVGNRGTTIPVRLHSKILNEVFGPKGNQLGDYLRAKFLTQVSNSYSTTYKRCKEYQVSALAFNEISKRVFKKTPLTADVDTSRRALARLREVHAKELAEGKFDMKDASNRLWHPLQNLRRADKPGFWKDYLPYNYDISACAPSVLYQLAVQCGMPGILADAIRLYVDTKGEFRKHVSEVSGLSIDDSKRLINSLFNGARLAKNSRCAAFQMLDFDVERMDRLQQDPEIIRLRRSIRNCWVNIEQGINSRAAKDKQISVRKAKVKWGIYFKLERKVLSVIMRELDNQGLQYFTEHDGFRTNAPANLPAIEQAIFNSTKLKLSIIGDQ